MSRTTRKKYRPRPTYLNAVAIAIERASKLPPASVSAAIAGVREAFHRLKVSDDPDQAWRVLADACNVAEQLAALGICSDELSVDVIETAQHALAAVLERQTATGSWAMRATEIQAIDAAIERHQIQLGFCSHREYEAALQKVRNVVAGALSGSITPRARIVGDLGGRPARLS